MQQTIVTIVCTPSPPPRFVVGGRCATDQILNKRGGGLTRSRFLEGVVGKEGVTFFRAGEVFA